MKIKRKEPWGFITYDTSTHDFEIQLNSGDVMTRPYPMNPLVLCAYISFACNMNCKHCVVRDFGIPDHFGETKKYDSKLISAINKSPFMVVNITGGEPLLPKLEPNLIHILTGLRQKGIMIDTNGTITPSKTVLDLIKKKDVLVRISWDTLNPNDEVKLRSFPKGYFESNQHYINSKITTLKRLKENGVSVAIQTVISGINCNGNTLNKFPKMLKSLNIDKWYLQRFIPSHKVKDRESLSPSITTYEKITNQLNAICKKNGIFCYSKRDKRHNSVFLLNQDGQLFTQDDDIPGRKICLGSFENVVNYFETVSHSDHSDRYFAGIKINKKSV